MINYITMSERNLVILFGSQTGTAEDVAQRIGRESQRRHIKTRVMPLDDYEIGKLLSERLVVFVVSTTGQGDPPDNMKKFWKFLLRKNLPSDSLKGVYVAVLGLGDSSYLKYNFIAKKLFRRLCQLGVESLVELALADEQHPLGLDATIDPWLVLLWTKVLELLPLPVGTSVIPKDQILPPKYKVEVFTSHMNGYAENEKEEAFSRKELIWNKDNPWSSTVVLNQRKTYPEHYQDVRYIKFDLGKSSVSYVPGDVLMVQPCNTSAKVGEFFELVQWDPYQVVQITENGEDCPLPPSLPRRCTLKFLFTSYLTLQAPPKRYFFELLSHFTTSEMEEERLKEFCSAEGQEDLYDYCYKPRRNYIEVLQDFPDACRNLKVEYLFDLFAPMQPRAFSIASSQQMNPATVDILMAVVKYKTKMFVPRQGVCSTWLSLIQNNALEKIKLWVVKGTIVFPKDNSVPVIMVGPGTGVAPFNSFIQERVSLEAKGEMILFFGCRNKYGDDVFRDDWNEYMNKVNLKIFTAYSRDQPDKIYVQHKMKEQGTMVWNLLSVENAYFFIAGNSKDMPNDVISCLKEIIVEHGEKSEDEANAFFKKMEMTRRFQCETWS